MNTQSKTTNRILFILSLIGIAIAVYVLQSWLRHTSIVCLTNGCETVRKSPASYIYGIPVPAFGLIGYTILAICAFLQTMHLGSRISHLVSRVMLGVALFGVAFVSWFTYTELFVIKGLCMWCGISGINMLVILLLAGYTYRKEYYS